MPSVRFKWDRAGYAEVMGYSDVQSMLDDCAEDVASRAQASLSQREGYILEDYEVASFQGKLTQGRVVRTKTDHARYSQAKNKTLAKALKNG